MQLSSHWELLKINSGAFIFQLKLLKALNAERQVRHYYSDEVAISVDYLIIISVVNFASVERLQLFTYCVERKTGSRSLLAKGISGLRIISFRNIKFMVQ